MGAVVLQGGQYGCVKHFFKILLGQRGALHVGHSSDLHRTALGIHPVYGVLPVLIQVDENLQSGGNTMLYAALSEEQVFVILIRMSTVKHDDYHYER